MSTETIYYKVTTDTFVRFFVVCFGVLLIYMLKDIIVSILVSVVIASAISPLATMLKKVYIPRALTVFLVLAGMITLFIGVFVLLIPLLYSEFTTFANSFYFFQKQAINFISDYTGNKQLVAEVIKDWSLQDIQNLVFSIVTAGTGAFSSAAGAVTYFIFQTVVIFVISFYLAVQENGVERFLRVITPPKKENYILDLWGRSQVKIAAWVRGQLILAVMIGMSIYIGLYFIGVQNAFLFALLSALGEIVPLVGLMFAGLTTVLFAIVSNGVPTAMVVAIFFFVVTQFENHFFAPIIVNKVVGIPSVIVIISFVVGALLAGFWGVLLAVPVASVIMEYVGDIESSKKAQIESIS